MSENGDFTKAQECGDRALSIYYIPHSYASKPTYRFSTYNLDGNRPTSYADASLPWTTFEGTWYYMYFGYSY